MAITEEFLLNYLTKYEIGDTEETMLRLVVVLTMLIQLQKTIQMNNNITILKVVRSKLF